MNLLNNFSQISKFETSKKARRRLDYGFPYYALN